MGDGWVHLHLVHPPDLQPISRAWDGDALDASSLGSNLGEQLLGNCFRVCWVPLGTLGSQELECTCLRLVA